MIRVEYDGTTKALVYAGWALPGSSLGAAAWRIVQFTWSAGELAQVLWADGNANFDNVWSSRAALTYVVNDDLSLDSAGLTRVTPTGSLPGTSFTVPFDLEALLAQSPKCRVMLHSTPMRPIFAGSPLGNEVRVIVGAIETGSVVNVGAWFEVEVPL